MSDDMKDNSDPNKQLVALKYDQKSAPKVIAKAYGSLAEELLDIAKENNVMIHQDKELSQFLQHLEMGQEIHKELYLIIAELIAFAFVLQGKFPDKWKNTHNKVDIKS
jgi:flagellar biosynthesis protein